jgi:hypothetical protein
VAQVDPVYFAQFSIRAKDKIQLRNLLPMPGQLFFQESTEAGSFPERYAGMIEKEMDAAVRHVIDQQN